GQETGESNSLGVGEGGLDRGERGGWGGSGHRGTSRPGWNREAGPVPVPAVQRKPNVSHLATSRYAGKERVALGWQAAREILHTCRLRADHSARRRPQAVRRSTIRAHSQGLGRPKLVSESRTSGS